MEVDNLISQLIEFSNVNVREDNAVMAHQENMVILLRKAHSIMELLEYDNADLKKAINEIIAVELIDITNLEWTVELAKLAYEMELPYTAFWAAFVNILLINHQEFPMSDNKKSLIDLTYYVLKANRVKLSGTQTE